MTEVAEPYRKRHRSPFGAPSPGVEVPGPAPQPSSARSMRACTRRHTVAGVLQPQAVLEQPHPRPGPSPFPVQPGDLGEGSKSAQPLRPRVGGQPRQQGTDDLQGRFQGLVVQTSTRVEGLQQHRPGPGVVIEQSDRAVTVPGAQGQGFSLGFGVLGLDLEHRRRAVGATHRHHQGHRPVHALAGHGQSPLVEPSHGQGGQPTRPLRAEEGGDALDQGIRHADGADGTVVHGGTPRVGCDPGWRVRACARTRFSPSERRSTR